MGYTNTQSAELQKLDRKISAITAGSQKALNVRTDKMYFKAEDGETFDEAAGIHKDTRITFVQRDENTIELWKGDTQISGQGGDWEVVNALLLESSAVTQITGGANGETFRTTGSGDNDTTIDTPTYGQRTGQFTLTTRGRQEGQNWVTQNAPSNDFYILYNYQTASASSRQNPYISSDENSVTRYPMYVLDIIRGNVRETITLKVFQLSCHTSWRPRWTSGTSYVDFPMHDTYDEAYQYAYGMQCVKFHTAIYVERVIEGGTTTRGYYHASLYPGSTKGVKSILSLNITNIHYDSTLNMVVGTPYIYPEYSKEDSCCGQLGLRRDLETGVSLSEPLVIFNVNHPQNYANEFIMYKILKGESIT